ncbi:N-terminal cleavage protein [Clostridium novyi A str. 4552]|uniref:N-terminal cleavage protein n=1 Tax=Clostridium novyi A str. 4552 TaxID=1444289 RepID=A0A0A0I9X9_CLONO|nr:type II secretion system protein [Clostridium novyi]KGM97358.1 N-terminal cleavage protein [Clostridium novyi A str. 4552]
MGKLKLMFSLKFKKAIKKRGFTLIELIIVMAIILVMASFLIPKFNGYRGRAERVKAIDTGRQIYLSAMESYMENGGTFDGEKLAKTSKELLGMENVSIESVSEENVVINYGVDNKNYSLKFGKNSSNFYINNEKGEIYPEYKPTTNKTVPRIEVGEKGKEKEGK